MEQPSSPRRGDAWQPPPIPGTEAKLAEAEFFLAHLREDASGTHQARPPTSADAFRFYLSAFMNAAYSVSQYLAFEAQTIRGFAKSFEQWVNDLPTADNDLWQFMWAQRRWETHLRRTKTIVEKKAVPYRPRRGHPAYYGGTFSFVPSPDFVDPWAEKRQKLGLQPWDTAWYEAQSHSFAIKGEQPGVVETCERYVTLLRKLVAEFKASGLRGDRASSAT
jgi:hypothetical protein